MQNNDESPVLINPSEIESLIESIPGIERSRVDSTRQRLQNYFVTMLPPESSSEDSQDAVDAADKIMAGFLKALSIIRKSGNNAALEYHVAIKNEQVAKIMTQITAVFYDMFFKSSLGRGVSKDIREIITTAATQNSGSAYIIDEFFNLKGNAVTQDDISQFALLGSDLKSFFDGFRLAFDNLDDQDLRITPYHADLLYNPNLLMIQGLQMVPIRMKKRLKTSGI